MEWVKQRVPKNSSYQTYRQRFSWIQEKKDEPGEINDGNIEGHK